MAQPDVISIQKTTIDKEFTSINALDFGDKLRRLHKFLKDEDINNITKIKTSDFLSRKIYMYFSMKKDMRADIIDVLNNVLLNDQSLAHPVRLCYLRFICVEIIHEVSKYLYYNNIRDRLDPAPYFQILKFLLRSYEIDQYTKARIEEELVAMFNDPGVDLQVKMDIADVMLLTGRRERGESMLDEIRLRETREASKGGSKQTVYTDTQNVHNHQINKTVNDVARELVRSWGVIGNIDIQKIEDSLNQVDPENTVHIHNVLDRVQYDVSMFGSVTLFSVFTALWNYISQHEHREELTRRLVEEIVAMDNYCSTGHLSRFLNVFQGFTDDPKLMITISTKDQMWSVISHHLNKKMEKADDKILDAMISDDKTIFLNFVKLSIAPQLKTWLKEYGNVEKEIITALIKYTGSEKWYIDNGVLNFSSEK